MTTILAAILVFGVLIATHEFGHFISAKLSGIKVLEFAIGMGPKIVSFTKKETDYTLRLLPIGGYVKMLGDEEGSDDPRAFCNQNPWKRLIVILSGAIFNILTAIVLFTIICFNLGLPKPIVNFVDNNSPAYESGIQVNDKILQVNDTKITSPENFINYISKSKDSTINVKVQRGDSAQNIKLTPKYDEKDNKYKIGVGFGRGEGSFLENIKGGITETFSSIKQLVMLLGTLITGGLSIDALGGPVAIVNLAGESAKAGSMQLIYLMGFLSINLGVMNLIPFPALDGGWIIIILIEALTGKKIDQNKLGLINFIGFALLMTLIVFVTYNDILRFFK